MLNKNLSDEQSLFYAQEIISKGWSRDMLLHAVKGSYYENLPATPQSNNFKRTLPTPVADYANEVFRSRYNLGFLGAKEPMKELKLERRLVNKITRFILELGKGFTFIGNQHILPFNGKEYKVDMLFFHRGLHRMIAIDLKVGEFRPEYVGKMNYYLTLLDRMEKAPDEEPSIGLILCAEKDHLDVEVALQDIGKPIGVAEYQYLLPKEEILQIVSAEMNKEER
jgi:predicted nuclease of restriction endonuclease-like (RecB) superfamily